MYEDESGVTGNPFTLKTEVVKRKVNIKVVKLTLIEVNSFAEDPGKFRLFFIRQFPDSEVIFQNNSDYAFRGARTWRQKANLEDYIKNLTQNGIEFNVEEQERLVGIYLQPGERLDSYQRSVGFAFGNLQPEGQTSVKKPEVGDIGVFSVYRYKKESEYLVEPESQAYPGIGASNKKFVPKDKRKNWNDLREASIVFQIV